MKITKYPQSCILIETKGKKILIDPGNITEEKDIQGFTNIDAILITHKHSDHCYLENIQTIKNKSPNLKIIGNEETKEALGIDMEIVNEGDVKEIDRTKIEVTKAVHGYHPMMEYTPKGNGFIIDDGKIKAYHCGDTIAFYNEYKANIVFVPICGHGVVMEPDIAVAFCQKIQAKLTIPIHYDSEKHPLGTEKFEQEAKKEGLNYKVLQNGESIEVN